MIYDFEDGDRRSIEVPDEETTPPLRFMLQNDTYWWEVVIRTVPWTPRVKFPWSKRFKKFCYWKFYSGGKWRYRNVRRTPR